MKINSTIRLWAPVYLYAALIFTLSSFPQPQKHKLFAGADKIIHLLEYAGLAVLLARAFLRMRRGLSVPKCIIMSFVIASVYGISDEFHQHFVPTRNASAQDALFDSAGALLGAVIYTYKARPQC